MWKNNTSSVPLITSTLLLALTVGISSTAHTIDVHGCKEATIYQSYISTGQDNKVFAEINNTDSASAMLPEALKKNREKIKLISSLKDNWNGNGALAFNAKLIGKIKNAVSLLVKQPEIFPTAANSIQLEYDGSKDSYLEIEIFESGLAEVFRVNKDGSEDCFYIHDDVESLNELVTSFYG